MKKLFCFGLALALLGFAGCSGEKKPDEPAQYLRLDGATANIPLAVGFYREYYKLSQEEAEALVQFSKSSQSYLNFLEGGADLLLVSRADAGTQEAIDQSGIALEYIPLRRDALCFIVNAANPIDSLADSIVKDIYQGKLLRWDELEGGQEEYIIAYQRNEDSGSQAMMRRLVMAGLEMAEPVWESNSMEVLVGEIAEYDNAAGAIGYTTYYFADEMYQGPDVKFLKINGVAPTAQTIADGTYPYLNENNIVIRADAKKNSEVRKAAAWLKSAEGKKMMEALNYIPVE